MGMDYQNVSVLDTILHAEELSSTDTICCHLLVALTTNNWVKLLMWPFWESTLLRKKMRMANGDYRTQIRVTQQKFRGLKLKILLFMKIGIVTLQLDLT